MGKWRTATAIQKSRTTRAFEQSERTWSRRIGSYNDAGPCIAGAEDRTSLGGKAKVPVREYVYKKLCVREEGATEDVLPGAPEGRISYRTNNMPATHHQTAYLAAIRDSLVGQAPAPSETLLEVAFGLMGRAAPGEVMDGRDAHVPDAHFPSTKEALAGAKVGATRGCSGHSE